MNMNEPVTQTSNNHSNNNNNSHHTFDRKQRMEFNLKHNASCNNRCNIKIAMPL